MPQGPPQKPPLKLFPDPPSGKPPKGLAQRLRRAASRELKTLVGDHLAAFTLAEVRQVLANPFVTPEVVEDLLGARHLASSYAFRRAIARHPKTPEVVAQRFLPGLFWRDLLEVSVDVRIHPAVRRVAEKYLVTRLPRMTVGEKVSLARRATHPVLAELRSDPNLRVVRAILENPRLTGEVLVPLAASSRAPRVLEVLAADPNWGRRYEVRVALAKNTAAPFRAILAVLPTLKRRDLVEIAALAEHSSVVRNRAQDLLAERDTDVPEDDVLEI